MDEIMHVPQKRPLVFELLGSVQPLASLSAVAIMSDNKRVC